MTLKQVLKRKLATIDAFLLSGKTDLLEQVLEQSKLDELLSEEAIAIARAEKKGPLILFLCTLAVHNDINPRRASHWLDIYQSIDTMELKGSIARLGINNILFQTVTSIIEKKSLSKEVISKIKGDRSLWLDSIDLLIDHNQWNSAYNIFSILANRAEKVKTWLQISKHLCDRHPIYINQTGLQKVDVDYSSLAKLYRYCANATNNSGLKDITIALRQLEASTLEMCKDYTNSILILKNILKEKNTLSAGIDLARVYTKNNQIEMAIRELDRQLLLIEPTKNKKINSDNANQSIDTDNPVDQDRVNNFNTHKAALALADLYSIANKSGMEVFLAFGTLLGCMRDGDFLGHDKDIDVGIVGWEKQYDLCIELIKSGKFMFDAQFLKQENTYYIPILHKPTGMWIDIFIFHESNNKLTTAVDFFFGYQQKYSVSNFELKEYNFVDINVLIPKNPSNYLEETYSNWEVSDPVYVTQLESPSVLDKGGLEFMLSARITIFSAINKKSPKKIRKVISLLKNHSNNRMNFDDITLLKIEEIAKEIELSIS